MPDLTDSIEEVETGGFLGLSGQSVYPNGQGPVSLRVSVFNNKEVGH